MITPLYLLLLLAPKNNSLNHYNVGTLFSTSQYTKAASAQFCVEAEDQPVQPLLAATHLRGIKR